MELLHEIRRYLARPRVRPWALAVPILTLLVCLPMLRPLRHPDPRQASDDELARLATIQAIADGSTLAIDQTRPTSLDSHVIRVGENTYSDQPPVMSLLLAGAYWVMKRFGVSFEANPNLAAYLLTVIGTTLPIALAGGLVYRMGRVFELRRPARTALAAAVVFGTGLVSYGVVLNAHAPAAALLLASTGCLIHVAVSRKPSVSSSWLIGAGFTAALAAVIEPLALLFMLMLATVPLALRWRASIRIGGVLLFLIGATPPLVLHAVLTVPVTGDLLSGAFHPELVEPPLAMHPTETALAGGALEEMGFFDDAFVDPHGDDADAQSLADEQASEQTTVLAVVGRNLGRLMSALVGPHGVLSHFPVIIFGIAGVFAVMHRHWPTATKILAGSALAGGSVVLLALCLADPAAWRFAGTMRADLAPGISTGLAPAGAERFGGGLMFAAEPFILFLPLLLFWSGAWLRRPHRLGIRVAAGILLAFSTFASVIGMTDPTPRGGYGNYSLAEALHRLTIADDSPLPPDPALLANNPTGPRVLP